MELYYSYNKVTVIYSVRRTVSICVSHVMNQINS